MLRKNEAQVFYKRQVLSWSDIGEMAFVGKLYENQVLVWNERQVLR